MSAAPKQGFWPPHLGSVYAGAVLALCFYVLNQLPGRLDEGPLRGGYQGFPWTFYQWGIEYRLNVAPIKEIPFEHMQTWAFIADLVVAIVIIILAIALSEWRIRRLEARRK